MARVRNFSVTTLALVTLTTLVSACSAGRSTSAGRSSADAVASADAHVDTTPDGTSTARTLQQYKEELAHRISETNSTKVYPGRPQALLRAVVVIKFSVDAGGKLLRSEIVRGNRDSATEFTALSSLRATAPFPKPAPGLLRNGRVEISETFLFNRDGRYQIRSIAQPQLGE